MLTQCNEIEYIIGSGSTISAMGNLAPYQPFAQTAVSFVNYVSDLILHDKVSRQHDDIIAFGFWCRKSSIAKMKEAYHGLNARLGYGVVFHIAPSNVALIFAYSFIVALLSGNASIIRLPSKKFAQTDIVCGIFLEAMKHFPELKPYISLIRYERDKRITDKLSLLCDVRIIWGGDKTIEDIRSSTLRATAKEITFPDRYSICLIHSDEYLAAEGTSNVAARFYNDTYLSDQNACTSPKIIVWLGGQKEAAKDLFWKEVNAYVKTKYTLQAISALHKLENTYRIGMQFASARRVGYKDNYAIRINIDRLDHITAEHLGHSGFFLEYDAVSIDEIYPIAGEKCQTVSYYGVSQKDMELFLLAWRPKGIDRIVPIGTTMDFSMRWDGKDLLYDLTRVFFLA